MNFADEINKLELLEFDSDHDYIIQKGTLPILFTAPHTMKQIQKNGIVKANEPYTKAIALYLHQHCNVSAMVKIKDTGIDANRDNRDEFKTKLLRLIKNNQIRLVIDLHGAAKTRDFDVEFGTLNNLSADFSTIKELAEAFTENGIMNVKFNDPFKGGAIAKYVCGLKDVDVIQVEINGKYRDYQQLNYLEQLCCSFENFIQQYKTYTNR